MRPCVQIIAIVLSGLEVIAADRVSHLPDLDASVAQGDREETRAVEELGKRLISPEGSEPEVEFVGKGAQVARVLVYLVAKPNETLSIG